LRKVSYYYFILFYAKQAGNKNKGMIPQRWYSLEESFLSFFIGWLLSDTHPILPDFFLFGVFLAFGLDCTW
jgi:hypothetical protein